MIHHENLENNTTTGTALAPDELYDLSMLEEMDDNEYMVEMLTTFLTETPAQLNEMNNALHGGNNTIVATKAHAIKGSAGVIQANKFIDLLVKIENIAKKGLPGGELKSLVENAKQLYITIELSLQRHLKALV